jgi:hypothetical protein
MRANTQISLVVDGPVTRVHVIAFDLDHPDPQRPIYQLAYDSGVPLPGGVVDVPFYLEHMASQLRAKIALERQEQGLSERGHAQRFLS